MLLDDFSLWQNELLGFSECRHQQDAIHRDMNALPGVLPLLYWPSSQDADDPPFACERGRKRKKTLQPAVIAVRMTSARDISLTCCIRLVHGAMVPYIDMTEEDISQMLLFPREVDEEETEEIAAESAESKYELDPVGVCFSFSLHWSSLPTWEYSICSI